MALNNPYALSFDGVDDYVQISSNFNLNSDDFYISFWAYLKNSSTYQTLISLGYNSSEGFTIITKSGTNNIRLFFNGAERFVTANEYIDTWLPIILHRNGTTINFIVADEKFSMPYSGNIGNFDFILGKSGIASQFYLNGNLDEIIIRKGTYSLLEIQDNINKYLSEDEEGLVAHYRCDEDYGNTLIDSSSNGNDGIIYGATYVNGSVDLKTKFLDVATLPPTDVTYDRMTLNGKLKEIINYPTVDCKFQYSTNPEFSKLNDINNLYALNFDGVDDYVDCGDNVLNLTDFSQPYTIHFLANGEGHVVSNERTAGDNNYGQGFLKINSNGSLTFTQQNSNTNPYTVSVTSSITPSSINEINFYSFGADLASGTFRFKINNQFEEVTSSAFSNISHSFVNLEIGRYRNYTYTTRFFIGTLDEVRIWNRALTQEEIQNNMNRYLTGEEDGLVAYYRCDEGDGNTLIDATGNGNDGVINGATYVPGEAQLDLTNNVLGVQETEPQTIKDTVLSFDGVDDYITSSNLNNVELKTIEFSFNHPYDVLDEEIHNGKYIGSFSNNTGVLVLGKGSSYIQDETLILYDFSNENVLGMSYIKTPIYKGKNHLALVWNGSHYDFFLNGVQTEVFSYNGHCPIQTPDFVQIGKRKGYNQYFQGTLNEIRLWDYARLEAEIQYYMNKKLTGNESGLIAYYNCDNSNDDETTLVDLSGNGNDGTINGATYTESPDNLVLPVTFSKTLTELDNSKTYYYRAVATTGGEVLDNYNPYSLSFDGINDYVKIPYNTSLEVSQALTVEFWTNNWTNGGSNRYIPVIGHGSFVENSWHIVTIRSEMTGDGEGLAFLLDGNTDSFCTYYIPTYEKTHYAFVYDGTKIYFYVNGNLYTSGTTSITSIASTTKPLYIGWDEYSSVDKSGWYQGELNEIRVWNYACSQTEIQNNMNRRLTGDEEGLVAYYRCDKQVNHGVLIDSSGNDNHGVIYGATWVKN